MVEVGKFVEQLEATAHGVLLSITDAIQVHLVVIITVVRALKNRPVRLGRKNMRWKVYGLVHL